MTILINFRNQLARVVVVASTLCAGTVFAGTGGFASLNGGTTGGAGGQVVYATSGTEIHAAICNRASNDTPIIIHVAGTINHGNTFKQTGSCNTADGVIELKDINNVSIIGVGSGVLFDELGIHIRNSSNIILQNLHVRNVKKSGSPTSNGGDAIGMESDVSNVWVDHVTLEAQGGESDGYDALFDMKAGTKYVTLSYSILRNSGRGGLVGSSDSDTNNGPVTFHHNLYQNIDSRLPLLRGATAHAYNNFYEGINKSGMNPRIGGQIKAEHNVFKDSKDPIGTFYTNDMGYWDLNGNIFDNVTWTEEGDKNHPAGPDPVSTTYVTIPYSYTLDAANCVRDIVLATAGANKGLAVSDGSCSPDSGGDNGGDSGSDNGGNTGKVVIEAGTNFSIGAGSDGSSKGSGTSYGNVRDGNTNTYWSPSGSTGTISIKGLSSSINAVRIIEAAGSEGTNAAWTLVNADNGNTLAAGNALPSYIVFEDTSLTKISFVMTSANGTPRIAEFETYHATLGDNGSDSGGDNGSDHGGDNGSDNGSDSGNDSGSSTGVVTAGENFSLSADSDGSSKGNGTSYSNVRDGNLTTYWSPSGTTGRISVKGLSSTINAVRIIELAGSEGTITSWKITNHDNGEEIASGSTLNGYIVFDAISPSKLNLEILSATGTPRIAEFETHNATLGNTDDNGSGNGGGSGGDDNDGGINYPDAACAELINNDNINWRESSLQSDQEIVKCLSESLGTPVGYGENTTGGYDPYGSSNLVVITNDKPEDQILAAISSSDFNWIVFDKEDFKNETPVMMYRPYCTDSNLRSALGADEQTCRNPYAWCSENDVSSSDCLETFFNDKLNDKSLPVRNYLIDSNTTIDGRGANATFTFNGFKIGSDASGAPTHTSENVIITNNKFVGVGHVEDHNLDPDMIRSTGASHDIWIHQNTFDTTGDSAYDVKVGAYDITVSFNKLVNVKRAALHGSSDSREINSQITTTVHNNLYVTTDEHFGDSSYNTMRRVPLLRRGQTHLLNNVFYGYRKDLMSLRVGAKALLEENLFMNPVDNSKEDDLSDWQRELFADAVTDGALEVKNSYVYESGENCSATGTNASLDVVNGSVPNMMNDYNGTSQSSINSNRLSAGNDLRNYVLATAGKGALTPWVSTYSPGKSHILSAAPSSCQ
ncbi:pectate trisaccharide-lyase [Reinekea sp. G2M2-21]|uniref:pectate lyase family protein n=1 Tax=Reinekea sp. G2M2-21 TaxID=2788942 RepID=UPI0018A8D0AD|nr:pectate trisaccharide-lyase [Reinekea sp. G2M2-21]